MGETPRSNQNVKLISTLAFLQDFPGFQKSGSQDNKKIVQALQAGLWAVWLQCRPISGTQPSLNHIVYRVDSTKLHRDYYSSDSCFEFPPSKNWIYFDLEANKISIEDDIIGYLMLAITKYDAVEYTDWTLPGLASRSSVMFNALKQTFHLWVVGEHSFWVCAVLCFAHTFFLIFITTPEGHVRVQFCES